MNLLKLLLKRKPVATPPAPAPSHLAAHAAAQDAGIFNPWFRRP